jgi:hypothetical protein
MFLHHTSYKYLDGRFSKMDSTKSKPVAGNGPTVDALGVKKWKTVTVISFSENISPTGNVSYECSKKITPPPRKVIVCWECVARKEVSVTFFAFVF